GAPGGGYETVEKTLSDETEWPYPTNLVLSTVPSGYAYYLGTSMAAPQVTGLVGLLKEVAPTATPVQVKQTIKQSADLVPGKSDPELGAGRINAKRTVESGIRGHRKGQRRTVV
ncbi:MAG TPA: S8 family serine peptidase, partial [Halococcus sp.]|nr:S8 family serine peptidase [Halococcus sp.]